ncbi:Uncharacterised protein [Mycobacteroides abscessus subsp. massiliense]|nr:Uncharacterised protein [Mycobacteroides abscessus subsp. abscessus]SKQ83020.1 Uncharacterised protein [Mycobacteroides abscessus subsp. massiliense]SLC50060.1 Uncharacterised protein [Mycobacteroides abscessus subsp. massiliense]
MGDNTPNRRQTGMENIAGRWLRQYGVGGVLLALILLVATAQFWGGPILSWLGIL